MAGSRDKSSASDDAGSAQPPRIRRRLIGGYRPGDVDAALRARAEELEELRGDVAALWVAVGMHEQTIRELREAGPGAQASTPEADVIEPGVAGLEEIVAAIEEATRTLERTYPGRDDPPGAEAEER